jgi:hypothetical protein
VKWGNSFKFLAQILYHVLVETMLYFSPPFPCANMSKIIALVTTEEIRVDSVSAMVTPVFQNLSGCRG